MNETGHAGPPERQFLGVHETVKWYEGVMQRISSPLTFRNQETTVSADGARVFVENGTPGAYQRFEVGCA